MVMEADGSAPRAVGAALADGPDAWTQFAGWSPDGRWAIVARGWQDPANAQWEEEHRTFRMDPGRWQLDSCLVNVESGRVTNLTAVERVSHYNGGLFFLPDGRGLGFTALIGGVSKPYQMDLDGRNKRDVSGAKGGFAYGYSASPDGRWISYHEDYRIVLAGANGTGKKRLETGHPFNFAPSWSPDSEWLLFLAGVHGRSNPYLARRDGSGLRQLADLGGYQGWILFLDVPDFHQGSSDVPVWAPDGRAVFHTGRTNGSVELFRTDLDGRQEQLTRTPAGTLHYHPQPSPDGGEVLYGSLRDGVRQLYALRLGDGSERALTRLPRGRAALWAHAQPAATPAPALPVLLRGEARTERAPHGEGNVYAPEVRRDGSRWWMWYGGQGGDGHDRIHLATSEDGRRWVRQGVAVDCGTANHVNDPTVVRVGPRWWMFYTVAGTGERDEIAAATSTDGLAWEKRGVVLSRGPAGGWDSGKVGRPSVLHENGVFRMWYDGQPGGERAAASALAEAVRREGRAVGYAESRDGLAWERRPEPVFREGSGAVAVARDGARLLMVIESGRGTRWATSPDGLAWTARGMLLPRSGGEADQHGQVTPFLHLEGGRATLYFGAARRRTWDGNAITAVPVTLP